MIDELRPNIYDFQQYLVENDIIYSIAHPLFSVNDRMTVQHVEKLLLLFKRFEGINGTRESRASELVNTIFRNLTPKMMDQMANTHDMDPLGPEPWKKFFTGGSDDHGGQYIASAYTTTPSAQSLAEFLSHLRTGRHEMGGKHGTSLQLAHSFFHIAYDYYKSKLLNDSASRGSLIADLLHRLLNRSTHASNNGLGGKVKGWVGGAVIARKRQKMNDVERIIFDEFREMVETDSRGGNSDSNNAEADSCDDSLSGDETFRIASRISHKLGYTLTAKFLDRLREGDIFESLQTIASLGPVALGVAPYLTAVKTQHKDERLLQSVARHFGLRRTLRIAAIAKHGRRIPSRISTA